MRYRHIKRYGGAFGQKIQSKCLFRYGEPVSPHLAAKLAHGEDDAKVFPTLLRFVPALIKYTQLHVPSDHTFVDAIASHVRACAAQSTQPGHMYIETAGGKLRASSLTLSKGLADSSASVVLSACTSAEIVHQVSIVLHSQEVLN